jgi:hypothetical protein
LLEKGGRGADKLSAVKTRTQSNHMGSTWHTNFVLCADDIDLPFDGIARDGASGPSFGHHGTQPDRFGLKQSVSRTIDRRARRINAGFWQIKSVQSEMWGARNRATSKGSLKLGAGFESLHTTAKLGSLNCQVG